MFSSNEIICRFTKGPTLSTLKCDPEDALVELVLINKLISDLRIKEYKISIYRYSRSDWKKLGSISSESNLQVGKFTNNSHGIGGDIRKFGCSTDFYFSIFLFFQRNLISRKKLLLKQYSPNQISQISESDFWETKEVARCVNDHWFQQKRIYHARVKSRNVVIDEISYYHCEGALQPTNWKSDVYELSESEVLVRTSSVSSDACKEIKAGAYIGSRKDSFYFHAMHWTLLKFLNLDPAINGLPIIIDSNLNLTVKNFILARASRDFPDSKVIEIPEGCDYLINDLHLVMLNTSYITNRNSLAVDESFRRILYEADALARSSVGETGEDFVLICKREHGVLLKRPTLANWDEVIQYLASKIEVVVIDPAVMSLEEQALYFSKAKYVISEHGGALSNLVFVKKQCQIIELQLTLFDEMYGEMARSRSLSYRCIKVEKSASGYILEHGKALLTTD